MKEQENMTRVRRRRTRTYSAKEKSQAVLSLWNGRRSAASLMKTMDVPWALLNNWEKRALTGMLSALDPTWQQSTQNSALPSRVERLLQQTLEPSAPTADETK
jgi:transposase-like protein